MTKLIVKLIPFDGDNASIELYRIPRGEETEEDLADFVPAEELYIVVDTKAGMLEGEVYLSLQGACHAHPDADIAE